jgi:hypothetical protein
MATIVPPKVLLWEWKVREYGDKKGGSGDKGSACTSVNGYRRPCVQPQCHSVMIGSSNVVGHDSVHSIETTCFDFKWIVFE